MASARHNGARLEGRYGGARGFVREAQLGLYLACDAGWLFAASIVLGRWLRGSDSGPLIDLPTVVGVLVGAAGATRVVLARYRSIELARATLALLGILVALLAAAVVLRHGGDLSDWDSVGPLLSLERWDPGALGVSALVLLAWWRGIAAGRARLLLDTVQAGFRTAMIALVGLFVLNGLAPQTAWREAGFMSSALLVLFAGLAGLPLASVLDLSDHPRHRGGPRVRLSGHWLGLLLGSIAVLLLISLLLAGALTFERLEVVLQPLAGPLDALLWIAAYAIAVPAALLIEAIVMLVQLALALGIPRQPFRLPDLSW